MTSIRALGAAAALWLASGTALGQWQLDEGSSGLQFLSVKNNAVAESHHFGSLSGAIGADGSLQFSVALDSVATAVDIRDQRMRELLFETVKFPLAKASAKLDPALLAQLSPGTVVTAEVPVTLALHGSEAELQVPVVVVAEPGGLLRVVSTRPVVVNAAAFGLDQGVAALQQIAGLKAIADAVPVTFQLLFRPALAQVD